ncbi:MAG: hypothetical protein ABSG89_08875 [Bacteroidales bacterium]
MNRTTSIKTILVIVLGFIVIYLLTGMVLFLYLATGTGVIALISDRFSVLVSKGWLWLGNITGSIISRILLTLVFCLIILQSMAYRIIKGRGPLDKKDKDSFYHIRNHEYIPSDMEELW